MPIEIAQCRKFLNDFALEKLFVEHLGWDRHKASISVAATGGSFTLRGVAEKRGFSAFVCEPAEGGAVPDHATRALIDREVTKHAREHVIVYTNAQKSEQVWQWVRRAKGQPIKRREFGWRSGQATGLLLERVLPNMFFELAVEEKLTLSDVTARASSGFDVEKVTKKFFERFQAEHKAFHKFIDGIEGAGAATDKDWYASVMLNRLMFCYFIQKKGLLDGDHDYLRSRLGKLQATKGKDKFWSFYRQFLLKLFHEGLSTKEHPGPVESLIGKIPYLNGGLFDVHELETRHKDIEIPDKAFERLFKFFDEYTWHLDDRPLTQGNEINPDVLGYIFEKYINQKQMGAYYTKEDITEYISKNTIVPFILDQAAKDCAIAFKPAEAGSVWRLLKADPDCYIYDAVLHGVVDNGKVIALPANIEAGVADVSKRGGWNKPAPQPFALPTETWREHVARRQRCLDLRSKLSSGEVTTVNDLVTFNLDIRQFAEDVISSAEGPDLLRAIWKAVKGVTVLDPTCGSGAFLFAALNILEPLYEACLDRMAWFLDDLKRAAAAGDKVHADKFKDFRGVLAEVAKHPNQRYFILKSIIVSNLYGVDIMEEACEICKLRLFLKLVAQVEEGVDGIEKIEPLPDIDFNIRAGNTLVGFVSEAAVRASRSDKTSQRFDFGDELAGVLERCEQLSVVDRLFREMQTEQGVGSTELAEGKKLVREKLKTLHEELDRYLASECEVDPAKPKLFAAWRKSHEPFHWFVDFYSIMASGGFDVIVGNPPYVEYRKVRDTYEVQESQYRSFDAKNLYALCVERSAQLLGAAGYFGMIVPSGLLGLDDAVGLRKVLLARYGAMCLSTYAIRPSKLFDGVDQRLCIAVAMPRRSSECLLFTTRYSHWNAEEREYLFATLRYAPSAVWESLNRIAQVGNAVSQRIVSCLKARATKTISAYYDKTGAGFVAHYHRSPRYWIRAMDFEPLFKSATRDRSVHHFRDLVFRDKASATANCAIINSGLFFFWFLVMGNGRNLTGPDIEQFPVGDLLPTPGDKLSPLFDALMADYKKHSVIRERTECTYQEFRPSLSKAILDRIDLAQQRHYGFDAECIDYILNFEIKYRLGDAEEEEA